jgi:hypothetical protein
LLFCVHLLSGFCSLVFNVASTEILHSYIISTLPRQSARTTQQPAEALDGLIALAHDHIAKKNHCTFGSYKFGKGWALDMLKVPETGLLGQTNLRS